MAEPSDWVLPDPDGCLLRIHVRPGARHDQLAGLHGTALCVRVRARPVEGAANAAVLALIADLLDLPARDVALESGVHAREKRLRVRGLDAATARARLEPRLRVDRGGAGG